MIDFSVVVTIYNCSKYIEECLDSILKQNDVSFELICIDDCSTDNSFEVAKRISEIDDRIKLIKNIINLGPSSSRNIGLKEAKGRMVCFVDGDDMLAENALRDIKEIMTANSLDMLSYSGLSFTEEKMFKSIYAEDEYMLKSEYSEVATGIDLINQLMDNCDSIRNCVFNCISKDFVDREGLMFKEGLRYADDNMFVFLVKAKRVLYTNNNFYRRRYRSGSTITSQKTSVHLKSYVKSYLDDLRYFYYFENTNGIGGIEKYLNRKLQDILNMQDDVSKNEVVSFEGEGLLDYFYKYFINGDCIYSYMISEKDRINILEKKNIYIYGAKKNAHKVSTLLDYWGVMDYCFVTTNQPTIDCINKKNVRSFFDIINDSHFEKTNSIFIIATSNMFHSEIERILIEHGLFYCKIIE